MKTIGIIIKLFVAGVVGLLLLNIIHSFAIDFAEAAGVPTELAFIGTSALVALLLIAISLVYKAPTLTSVLAKYDKLREKYEDLGSEYDELQSETADIVSDFDNLQKQSAEMYQILETQQKQIQKLQSEAQSKGNELQSETKRLQNELHLAADKIKRLESEKSELKKIASEQETIINDLHRYKGFAEAIKSKYGFIIAFEQAKTSDEKEAALNAWGEKYRQERNRFNPQKKKANENVQ